MEIALFVKKFKKFFFLISKLLGNGRIKQIFLQVSEDDFEEITNLKKPLRAKSEAEVISTSVSISQKLIEECKENGQTIIVRWSKTQKQLEFTFSGANLTYE